MSILVIHELRRYGGGNGYRAYGQSLPSYYTKSGSADDWHGATTGTIRELFGGAGRFYITENIYSYLSDAEIEDLKPVLNGIMPNVYAKMVSKRSEFSGRTVYSWILIPGTESRPVEPIDPCKDVTCPTACVGVDRYIQKCEDGACVRDRLLTRNSPDCGYEPPAPTPVPTPPVDPCEHVVCPAKCSGVDKYAQTCHNGVCVRGALVESNSEDCGYEQPDPTPDPTPTPTTDTYTYAIIALMVVGTYLMLRR